MALSNPSTGREIINEINSKLGLAGGTIIGDLTVNGAISTQEKLQTDLISDSDGIQMFAKTSSGVVGPDSVPVAQIVSGYYTGNGAAERTIDLGFTPSWVFVFPDSWRFGSQGYFDENGARMGLAIGSIAQTTAYTILSITTNGFKVYYKKGTGDEYGIKYQAFTNYNGNIFKYVAGK